MDLVITSWRGPFSRFLGFLSILLLPVGALGTKLGFWPFTTGFMVLLAAVVCAVLALLLWLLYSRREKYLSDRPKLNSAAIMALVPLLLFATVFWGARGKPLIHNISTDLIDPPMFVTALELRGATSNPVAISSETAALQQTAYPDITTITSSLTVADAVSRSANICRMLGWDIIDSYSRPGHIEATFTSFWFGFSDDIVIRVQPIDNGSEVDLHSVSRVGKGDLGANAARIREFTKAYTEGG